MAFCKNCGAELADGATFCASCGTTVEAQAPQNDAGAYQQPTYQQPQYQAPVATGTPKSKMVAGLLGIFLGALGIHNFYVGNTKRALIQLLVSLLLSWTGIAPAAMGIWGLIEGIFYLTGKEGYTTDANGVPLTD